MASVRRCIDCDVVLVDEIEAEAEGAAAPTRSLGDGDQVGYELEGWGNQLKVTLEGMLDRAGVRRVWESGALVVPAADEELVDGLVATVEGGDVPELDDESPQIAFEIQGLDPDELADLDARLIAAHLGHVWDDEGALLVAEADEDAAAAMINEVLAGPDEDEPDGLAAHQALSELYVAIDKLVKAPADAKLARRYRQAAAGIADLSVPYGLSGADWADLTTAVCHLAGLAGPPDADAEPTDDGAEADADAVDDGAKRGLTESDPAGTDGGANGQEGDDTVGDPADDTEGDDTEGDDSDGDDTEGARDGRRGLAGAPSRIDAAGAAAVTLRERLRDLV
ncbi:MAG: hypothetical protein ACR2MB_03375 [Acidimicrobiales bacterium]